MLKKLLINLLITSSAILATAGFAQDDEILRPEEAYRYAVFDTGSAIEIDWLVEDGYYLYRNKMSYASGTESIALDAYELPQGEHHEDEFFGVQQIYRNRFFVTIPYSETGAPPETLDLIIKSQGCADIGICYPPQSWTETIELAAKSESGEKLTLNDSFGTFGGVNGDFLPVDEAFEPIVTAIDGNNVEVAIRVADGYYLYKDKISAAVQSDVAQAGRLELPTGEIKNDQYFGEMEVYHNDVFGELSIARATPEAMEVSLQLKYQGCADGGICYPPETKLISVALPEATAVGALAAVAATPSGGEPMVSEQGRLAEVITTAQIGSVIAIFFGLGLLLAFTPCVLPMVPILSGIIAGEGDDISPARGFSLALSYVMGMALIYTAAGVGAAAAGLQLQATFNQPWVLILFSSLFVVLALGMFGMFEMQMPAAIQNRLTGISGNQKSGTAVGAFVMGGLSALVVTACVAPALIATLTVMAQTGDMLRGGTALFAMS